MRKLVLVVAACAVLLGGAAPAHASHGSARTSTLRPGIIPGVRACNLQLVVGLVTGDRPVVAVPRYYVCVGVVVLPPYSASARR